MPVEEQLLLVERPHDAPHVLVLTMNRPRARNAMSPELESALANALDAFDADADLWVCVIAGAGPVFCAGADLAAWQQRTDKAAPPSVHGFGALSRRTRTSKPIIAAVQRGGAHGGGCELALSADLIVAEPGARFAMPEAARGVIIAAGGLQRLALIAGHQLASEMALTGRVVTAEEAYSRFGFVNEIAPEGVPVLTAALALARRVCALSPDSTRAHKRALLLSLDAAGVSHAFDGMVRSIEAEDVYQGRNIREGLNAFVEKRAVQWTNTARL